MPTRQRQRPFLDVMAEDMIASLERNCRDFGIPLYDIGDERQGIVHVIGPELGLTQPGMTIACGDSHTSTHGAFGAVAFGIGTSQVRDVLASQCLALEPLKVRRIRVTGQLPPGVYAKDVILDDHPAARRQRRQRLRVRIRRRRHRAHVDGRADDDLQHVDRGRRARRLRQSRRDDVRVSWRGGRSRRSGDAFERAKAWWRSIASDRDAVYDDDVEIRADELTPVVTWGVNPGQSIGIDGRVPAPARSRPQAITDALDYMGLHAGQPIAGMKVDVAFIGSCTNGRLSDLREAARIVRGHHVAPHVQGARRARIGGGQQARPSAKGSTRRLPRRGLRMARRRLLDVPGHESRQARRQPGVRRLVESQLQGTAGEPDRPDAADEPGDGRRRGDRRRGHRRAERLTKCQLMPMAQTRSSHQGRALPLRGDDIDTDRIMPARFLRAITFDGLEQHVFEDDRKSATRRTTVHPFDEPAFQGASILLVNAQLRVRIVARARAAGAAALGIQRGRRRVVRRDLLRQLADDWAAVRDRLARRTSRR